MLAKRIILRITPFRIALLALSIVFLFLATYRLICGLGVTTNLNDSWPWGLWIGVDLTAIAIAGAGYSMCVMAHVIGIRDFHSVSRRATLISLLSYIFVLGTLMLEIGRWDNAHRPLFSWGYTSPMFEVYIAVTFYMIVQTIEFAEIFAEKYLKALNRFIKPALPFVFVVGAIIPFGHQASLGGIYLAMKGKLHGLWWSPMLPWFFLVTSFYVGQSVVILEALWSEKAFGQKIERRTLEKLALISSFIMAGYFALKAYDLFRLGQIRQVFVWSTQSMLFLLEMVPCVLIPAIIGLSCLRKSKAWLGAFGALSIGGIVLSRINVVFTGMSGALEKGYFPSSVEFGITLGLLAFMVLLYLFIVDNFAIHQENSATHDQSKLLLKIVSER